MKLVFLTSLLLIATSCSHSSGSAPQSATSATASAPAAAKAPAAKHGLAVSAKKTAANAAADHTTCKSSSEIRELIVVPMGAGGCELDYTKAKETKKIATAEHETGLCQQVLGKVRGHLEAAGFSCN